MSLLWRRQPSQQTRLRDRSSNRSCINPIGFIISFNRSLLAWRRRATASRSPTIQESTPCLSEHALWSPNCYVFGVIVVFKKLEKTQLFSWLTPNLSVDSILRFLLLMLQYIEQVYQVSWYLIGMLIGRFVYFFVGTESIRGYDSNCFERSY